MTARRLIVCVAMLVLAGTVGAETTLQELGAIETPAPWSWRPWARESLVVTDIDVRRVRWTLPAGERDDRFFDLPAPPTLLEAWGDSVLIQVPGEGGRLLDRTAVDPTAWDDVPANWHLANTEIGGQPHRIFVDPQFFLIVYSAPGPGTILSLLDFPAIIGEATHWSWDGDRAVLATVDGVHVVDLSNPVLPIIVGVVAPPVEGWSATGVSVRDHVVFVDWGDRIASYDLTNPGTPPLLDEVLNTDDDFMVGGRWLVSWNGELPGVLNVHDAADPSHLTLRGSVTTSVSLAAAQVRVAGDRVEIAHELGLGAYEIPLGSAPLEPLGFAWPVLEGWPLTAADNTAWLQGSGSRFVIDLTRLTVPEVQARPSSSATASLLAVADVLYFDPGSNQGVWIESLDDPRDPEILTILDPTPAINGIDVAGTLLAAADADGFVLYDVAEPAAPVRLGRLDLAGAPARVALVGDAAVVTAGREFSPDFVHVVDISDRNAPQPVATFELDPEPGSSLEFQVGPLLRREDRVHVMISISDSAAGTVDAIAATIDLTAPQTPQLTYSAYNPPFWCYDRDEAFPDDPLRPARDIPVTIADFHVSFRADTVSVYTYDGDPDALTPVTSWLAPGAVETVAAVGNKLLVLTAHRVDLLTLSDFEIVGVPDAMSTASVRAVPNPFNPQTAITFEMARAGAAELTIYDVRGHPVRRLRAELPAGPVSLTWRGVDQTGRALPSGTYLLRVVTPDVVRTGRCALVR